MKVLVTGGTGFIGSHVVENLAASGATPVIFDRHATPVSAEALYFLAGAGVEPCETILGDVRDRTAVFQAVAECDAVIHLAGILGTAEQVQDPMPAVEANIIGALNVFTAMRHYSRPGAYITLGNYWMNNTYSITKSTTERFALMANEEWGTKIGIIRAVNAYGPRQKTGPVRKIMPSMMMAAIQDKPITVYGDGMQVADMVYVTNVAEALVRATLNDHGTYDKIMEVGTGVPTTVLDVAHEIIKQAGGGVVIHEPMRPGEPEGSVVLADPSTLAPLHMTGIELIQLEEGVRRTLPYYQDLARVRL